LNPTNSNEDSASLVAPSYLSDFHVHHQVKPSRTLSGFQIKLAELVDEITRFGTIAKLSHITNGLWMPPLDCAQQAVNGAGSNELLYVKYRTLASADDNDVEVVLDQHLPRLQWPLARAHQAGSFFLDNICTQVFNMVSFFSELYN
jgi:hypothetical protein